MYYKIIFIESQVKNEVSITAKLLYNFGYRDFKIKTKGRFYIAKHKSSALASSMHKLQKAYIL